MRRAQGIWPAKDPLQLLEAVGRHGVFARMMEGLASEVTKQKTVMIDATCLKAHRTALSLRAKKGGPTTSAGV